MYCFLFVVVRCSSRVVCRLSIGVGYCALFVVVCSCVLLFVVVCCCLLLSLLVVFPVCRCLIVVICCVLFIVVCCLLVIV